MEEGLNNLRNEHSPVRSKRSVLRVCIDDNWKDYPLNEGLLRSDVVFTLDYWPGHEEVCMWSLIDVPFKEMNRLC